MAATLLPGLPASAQPDEAVPALISPQMSEPDATSRGVMQDCEAGPSDGVEAPGPKMPDDGPVCRAQPTETGGPRGGTRKGYPEPHPNGGDRLGVLTNGYSSKGIWAKMHVVNPMVGRGQPDGGARERPIPGATD